MTLKMSDLTPEQMKNLRAHAVKKVNKKLKTLSDKQKREQKWAKEQVEEVKIPAFVEADKVSVRLDSKTVIMVLRSKCEQLEDGTWVKKPKP